MQNPEINDTEITVRPARVTDADALAALVGELGYPTPAAAARERLGELTAAGACVLVARRGVEVIGLAVLQRTRFLHRPPDGRVATLVVTAAWRNHGIGARLLEEAETVFRQWGCGRSEVSSGAPRAAAHRFYRRAGYSEQPQRFIKLLE